MMWDWEQEGERRAKNACPSAAALPQPAFPVKKTDRPSCTTAV